jgi:hypothetical protein
MEKESPTIAQHDIYGVTYCAYKGIKVTLTKQDRRVIFNLPDTPDTYKALSEFNNNPKLRLLDYLTHLRKLRAQMISLRG